MKPRAPFVAYCDICGKSCKGLTPHGREVSRAMHYKKRHGLTIQVIETESERTLLKIRAAVPAV